MPPEIDMEALASALAPKVALEMRSRQWFTRAEFKAELKVGERAFAKLVKEGVVPKPEYSGGIGGRHVWTGAQVDRTRQAMSQPREHHPELASSQRA